MLFGRFYIIFLSDELGGERALDIIGENLQALHLQDHWFIGSYRRRQRCCTLGVLVQATASLASVMLHHHWCAISVVVMLTSQLLRVKLLPEPAKV